MPCSVRRRSPSTRSTSSRSAPSTWLLDRVPQQRQPPPRRRLGSGRRAGTRRRRSSTARSAETSPPPSSVRRWTTWLNSICSRRGRSRWCSFFIRYATPPLPDWLLTRMTASYERPMSLGSTGRYGTCQVKSSTGVPGLGGVGLQVGEALVDGVLVRAGERREDQVAAVGVPLRDRQLVAVLHRPTDLVDVGEVDLRVDALAEQVEPQRDQADVAGALAVAEQAPLDPVGARPGSRARRRRRPCRGRCAGAGSAPSSRAVGRLRCIHSIESA